MHWVHLLSGRPLVRIQPGVPGKRVWHMPGPFLLFVLWYALCPARIFEDAASDALIGCIPISFAPDGLLAALPAGL